jgi:hypothetical protein
MTDTNLGSVVEQLRAEQDRLVARERALQSELSMLQRDLKRVRGALAALGEKANTNKAAAKPAATKEDVVVAICQVLSDETVLAHDALRAKVEAALRAAGKSRRGLALRLQEALKDSRFADTPSGYRLRSELDEREATPNLAWSNHR